MSTYPVTEELPGQKTGVWQERLKAKRIYRELHLQRQVLKEDYKRQRTYFKIAILTIPLFILSFFVGIPLFEFFPIAPFAGMILLIVAIFVAIGFYSKSQLTKSKAQRFGVLGILSQKLAGECSLVDLFIDFSDATKVTPPYRTARSPYSGSIKRYYHFPWLRYDTNLLDGTKFLLSSHQKVKTKSSSTVRDITTFKFKFSFRVRDEEILPSERLAGLEDRIIEKIEPYFEIVFKKQQDYLVGGYVQVDYPEKGVLRFTLKIWGHSEHLIPSGLIVMLGEFNAAIRTSYSEHTGFALKSLKRSIGGLETVTEQIRRSHSVGAVEGGLKPRQWEMTTLYEEESQSPADFVVSKPVTVESPEKPEIVSIGEVMTVDLTLEEEQQFDKLNLYLGEPATSISDDSEPYLKFNPRYDFAELAVGIREKSFVWTAISSTALLERLEIEIGIKYNKDYHLWDTNYAASSAKLANSPISSFTVGLKLRDLKDDLKRLSIHSNDNKQPIIFVETARGNPKSIYWTYELIKSIARELRYPRFA